MLPSRRIPSKRWKLRAYPFIFVSLLAFSSSRSVSAPVDPVHTFIIKADSLARADTEQLTAFLSERSILVGAAVGQLLDTAFQLGEGGDQAAEKENVDFAERLARSYKKNTGSGILLELVETHRKWTPQQRALRKNAKAVEEEATTARNSGELDRAVELLHQAMSMYRDITDLRSQAVIWGSLGVVHWYRGDMSAVFESYQKALDARRGIEDRILEGKTLNGLGSANLRLGNYIIAISFYSQAIELRRRTGDLGGLGISLTYLGNTYYMMNNLVRARDKFEEALPILEKVENPALMIQILNSIANLYTGMGRIQRANEAYQRAIEIAGTVDQPQDEASCRINLADNLLKRNRYGEALDHLDIAFDLLERRPVPEKTALAYRVRGTAYLEIGELDKAREDLLAFAELSENINDPSFKTRGLIDLGYLYLAMGTYENGLSIAGEAETLARQSQDSRNIAAAMVLAYAIERARGRYQEALAHRKRSLEIYRPAGAEGQVLWGEMSIASTLAAMGRMGEARRDFERLRSRVLESGQNELEWALYLGIAHTYEKEDPDSAAFYYEKALERVEQSRAGLGGAEIRTGFLSGEKRYYYEEVARYYATLDDTDKSGGWTARAFRTIERAKARGLLDLLESSVLMESHPAEEAVLDSLYQLKADDPENKETQRHIEERYLELRDKRVEKIIGSSGALNAVADLHQIQKALPKRTVLLEYALGDTTSLLWVIDRDDVELHRLPDRKKLRFSVQRLRDAISKPGAGDPVLRKAARSLYETLLLPAEKRLSKAKDVIIVPDGLLFEVPFEVLLTKEPNENAGWEEQPFLALSLAPVYAPSASIYLKLRNMKRSEDYDLDLLAMGDPDFSLLAEKSSGNKAALRPLPHTRSEVQNIGLHVAEKRKAIFLGSEATEATLKDKLREGHPRLLHFATHGLVDPLDPASSSIALCPDSVSGEDGYLHTLEILSLPLDVDLVVLSACESARGKVGRGEGVVGLSRAFIAAGARGIVASLWAVSDESTSELMKTFYETMVKKKEPACSALNTARMALIKNPNYSHPFYWSPFIVIGTDRSPW
ncbi:MAG: CHAT domain-containing protein [Candidatus Latescibacteria bacterium]|nr:CHAT domain-containing protein [Candidatus Latescibacterota bacterium]